jgi:hypothetical protein
MLLPGLQNADKPKAFEGVVDAVVCINLTTRPERKAQTIKNFPYQFYFFEATPHPTSPMIGCTQSHLSVIKVAKEKGWKQVMVIEDDIKLVKAFESVPAFPSQFDMLYLGGICLDIIGPWWREWTQGRIVCMHCYIVPEHFYDTLLSCISFENPPKILDAYLCDCIHARCKAFMLTDFVAIQQEDWSDIDQKQKWSNYRWPRAGEWCDQP